MAPSLRPKRQKTLFRREFRLTIIMKKAGLSDMSKVIAQGIGFVGAALVFLSFQQKGKKQILLTQMAAGFVFSIHFIMLGAVTGAMMNAVAVARNLVFSRGEKLKRPYFWPVLFMGLFTLLGVLSWQNLFSLLPIMAMNLSNIVFSLKNPRYIRFCYVPVSVGWLIYNISAFSVAGIITEIFCLLSLLIAIVRYDLLKKDVQPENVVE